MTAANADVALAGHGTVTLRTASGASVVGHVRMATSFWARFRGLMGSAPLDPDAGLYLPVNSIHMLFMRFPIDCVFVSGERDDGSRQVVDVRERLRPWSGVVWWSRGAKGCVELPAGSLAAAGVRRGDYVRLESLSS